jgi:hypothetical protein
MSTRPRDLAEDQSNASSPKSQVKIVGLLVDHDGKFETLILTHLADSLAQLA